MLTFCKVKWGGAQAFDTAIFNSLKNFVFLEFAAQRPQAILLMPVFLALGIGGYFTLSFEPEQFYGVLAFALLLISCVIVKGHSRFLLLGLMCVSLGFVTAQIRTNVVYTPILLKKLDFTDVQGRITAIETLEKGVRLTLSDVRIDDFHVDKTPRKIRLKLWKGEGFVVGQVVRGLAALNPPSPPVNSRGFDFQRYMYFRGIGAVGFLYRPPEIVDDVSSLGLMGRVERLRDVIGGRIQGAIDAPQSGLARALMVGQRTSIDAGDMEAIRAAGLAHMLAISGLHVGLFSGAVFFALRFGLAFFPSLALGYPIKKYAAIAAMIAAFFYMLIAGATIPTQRAMITVAVIFTAILLDRSPISLRVVAFAAFWVLLLFPESLMSASFQMSFSAVIALVAFYDWTRPLWGHWARQAGVLKKGALYLVGVASTTVIATVATAPLTLFHFQALPAYGLIANIVCVPLLAFIVMPLAVLALMLMPFGLEGFALTLMEPGLSAILQLAGFVAELKGAVFHVPAFAFLALLFFVLMALSIVILRGRLRVIFVSVLFIFTLLNFEWIQYDMLVSSKVDLVALDPNAPQLIVSDARKSRFMRDNWAQAMGLEGRDVVSFPKEGALDGLGYKLSCDGMACRYEYKNVKTSYLKRYDVETFRDECLWADIVVAADIYDDDCGSEYVINRRSGKYKGIHAFSFDGGVSLERVEDFRGNRPWVQIPRKRY